MKVLPFERRGSIAGSALPPEPPDLRRALAARIRSTSQPAVSVEDMLTVLRVHRPTTAAMLEGLITRCYNRCAQAGPDNG